MSYANPEAKTARGNNGVVIRVGDSVRQRTAVGEPSFEGPVVTVVRMHRQGANGTILTTSPAPDPSFPHHFSGSARDFIRV